MSNPKFKNGTMVGNTVQGYDFRVLGQSGDYVKVQDIKTKEIRSIHKDSLHEPRNKSETLTKLSNLTREQHSANLQADESLKISRLQNAVNEAKDKSKYDDISPEEVIKLADKVRSMSIDDAEELFWSWYPHETSWSEMDYDLKNALIKVGRVLVQHGKLKPAYLPRAI